MCDANVLVNSQGEIQWVSEMSQLFKSAGLSYDDVRGSPVWDWSTNKKHEIKSAIASILHFEGSILVPNVIVQYQQARFCCRIRCRRSLLGMVSLEVTEFPERVLSLTDRERQTLALLGEYRTTAGIAVALGVSVSTVEHHRRSLKSKLRAASMAMLPLIAHRAGLSKDPLSTH